MEVKTGALNLHDRSGDKYHSNRFRGQAAMRPRRLPVIPTLVAAYRDWGGMLISMRAMILSAILIITAISVGEELVPRKLWEQQLSGEALGLVKDAIWAFLLASLTRPNASPESCCSHSF